MPSNYAHYKFGKEIYDRLPESIRRSVDVSPQLFAIGQHGPDILFYYETLHANPVAKKGSSMHARPAAEFFEPSVAMVSGCRRERGERAYLYGFVCHFMLDSTVHWYVEEKIEESGVSHVEIEGEFDRMLMQKDGLHPLEHMTAQQIVPSPRNAAVIAKFFPEFSREQILKSLQDMIFYSCLLVCKHTPKRVLLRTGLALLGKTEAVAGMIINPIPNGKCQDSNRNLSKLFDVALDETVGVLAAVEQVLDHGGPLPERFYRTFGPDAVSREEYKVCLTGETV